VVRRRLVPLALALALGALGMACSATDGRNLPPPDPARTTTTPSAPVIQTEPGDAFTLSSPSFVDGQTIPVDFTCQGTGPSPDLAWTGAPSDAAELALVVRDRSADGFLHWVVAGIDPTVTGFGRDGLPEGAVEAGNGAGSAGWLPPCPPTGSGVHFYELTLHALPGTLAILPGADGSTTADLIEQASMAETTLTVTYSGG